MKKSGRSSLLHRENRPVRAGSTTSLAKFFMTMTLAAAAHIPRARDRNLHRRTHLLHRSMFLLELKLQLCNMPKQMFHVKHFPRHIEKGLPPSDNPF